MRKTITINISGIVFYIEDNAFEVLRSYLNKLKEYFGKQSDGDEIIADIESRIAELFQEELGSKTEAIDLMLVQKVIDQLGTPKDFIEDEIPDSETTSDEDSKQNKSSSEPNFKTNNKKLYRDPDNRVFGGVCSGFSYYFGIDKLLLRIIFAILLIATFPFFLLIYVVLWIALPEAISAAQRLEMRGEPVNIDNIKSAFTKKKSKEEKKAETKSEKHSAESKKTEQQKKEAKHSHTRPTIRVKPGQGYTVKKKGNNFADVLLSLIKVFFIFIGSIVLVALLIALFSVVISLFAVSGVLPIGSVCMDDLQLLPEVFLSYNGSGFLGVVLVIGIPIFLLVFLITKIAFKHQGKTGAVIVLSFILWFVGIGLLLRTGFGILNDGAQGLENLDERFRNRIELIFGEFEEDWNNKQTQVAETYFDQVPDTLYINLEAFDTIDFVKNRNNYMKIENKNTYLGKPRIHLYTNSANAGCKVIQKTKDKNGRYIEAYYPVNLKNDTLHLPLYYSFKGFESRPNLDVNLKIPTGTIFYIIPGKGTKHLSSVVWSGESEVRFKEMPGKYLVAKSNGIRVLE